MTLIDPDNVKRVLAPLVAKADPSRPVPDDASAPPTPPVELNGTSAAAPDESEDIAGREAATPPSPATGPGGIPSPPAESASPSPVTGPGKISSPHEGTTESEVPAESQMPVALPALSALLDEPTQAGLESAAPGLLTALGALSEHTQAVAATAGTASDREAVALLRAAEAIRRTADSLFTTITARFERLGTPDHLGVRSPRALLMQQLRISGPEASRRIRLGRALGDRTSITGEPLPPEYPHIAERLRSGGINTDQAQAMLTTLAHLPPALRADHQDQAEALLATYADTLTVKDLRTAGARIIDHLDPDGTCPIDAPDPQNYALTLTALPSGDYRIRGLVDGLTGTTLATLIEERIKNTTPNGEDNGASPDDPAATGTARSMNASDGSADSSGSRVDGIDQPATGAELDPFDAPPDRIGITPTGDPSAVSAMFVTDQRTSHQQRYDAFCDLIRDAGAYRNAHGPAFALVITATAEQLARGTGTATTHNRTPIPVSTVLQHACTAKVYLHTWDDDRGTIAVKTHNRLANKNQLALLAARDQGCSFPDCEVAPVYCHAHHMRPYARGGLTDINNLTLVCPYHHAWHDRHGWSAELINGLPAWIPPAHLDPKRRPIHHSKFRIQLIPQLINLFASEQAPAPRHRPDGGEHRQPIDDDRLPALVKRGSPPRSTDRTSSDDRERDHYRHPSDDWLPEDDGWLTAAPPPAPHFNDPDDVPPF